MTLAINNLGGYIPKKRSKCPRRRASVDGPSPYVAQQPLGRMPRRSSCPSLKKNVAFSEHSNIRIVQHSRDDSAIEKWYSSDDHLKFKIDRTVEVRSFRKQAEAAMKQVGAASLCPVGIEQFLSSKSLESTKLNRRLIIKKVLLEQTRQRALGFRDPDQLASVAEQVSTESLKGAQKRGKFQEMSKFV
ncbi:hypothetical protein QTG54_007025 [Skeletonema marinoi]|uniref:Uncharacterized protein n=1 Tax=Skeletonema marinoi TaxID=267567 RepID=A0AAD8YCD5_9STRA|nr:hypothetical protein QTG54_007025 [Skeletonema marinoi]|mmetsp:Transcript_5552/g.7790  ORF Transcript_5552/g.7790 Transcript_5552/m.7790 type:complete len:188 (-) Transcript_5552:77-640(-)|eukprot:scaffold7897_cov130-Skeletonema_marinoi.AAC.4